MFATRRRRRTAGVVLVSWTKMLFVWFCCCCLLLDLVVTDEVTLVRKETTDVENDATTTTTTIAKDVDEASEVIGMGKEEVEYDVRTIAEEVGETMLGRREMTTTEAVGIATDAENEATTTIAEEVDEIIGVATDATDAENEATIAAETISVRERTSEAIGVVTDTETTTTTREECDADFNGERSTTLPQKQRQETSEEEEEEEKDYTNHSATTASERLAYLAEALEHYTIPFDTESFYEHRLFPHSKPLNVTVLPHRFRDIEWADYVVTDDKPKVVRNSMVSQWPAFVKWNAKYFVKQFGDKVKMHVSETEIVRMHSAVQPLDAGVPDGVTWTRPWREREVGVGSLFGERYVPRSSWTSRVMGLLGFEAHDEDEDEDKRSPKYTQMFRPRSTWPDTIRQDVSDLSFLSQPWRRVLEVNLWSGSDNITTPLHYDVTHNFYVQVKGRKRFVLFPPSDWRKLYLYPRIHPSTRSSQVGRTFPNVDLERFPDFRDATPYEVVLEQGDVLFIPGYWFHHVTALHSVAAEVPALASDRAGAEQHNNDVTDLLQMMRESSSEAMIQYPNMPSISVSVCSESYQVGIREDMLGYSLSIPGDWPFHRKVTVLAAYLPMFFRDPSAVRRYVAEIRRNRFMNFQDDDEVVGLHERQEKAAERFRIIMSAKGHSDLTPGIVRKLQRSADRLVDDVYSAIRGFLPEEWEIELANYFEDVICDVLGPLNVSPFLEHVEKLDDDALRHVTKHNRKSFV